MFNSSKFNRDISGWDISGVRDISFMFYNSVFDQDISGWIISDACDDGYLFEDCQIREEYKPQKYRRKI